jgi:hypothetical protein
MELNKKKSGIVVFAPRLAKKIPLMKMHKYKIVKDGKERIIREWIPNQNNISEIPIMTEYKYLGTYLDPKLTMRPQLRHIRNKSSFLFIKLYPYLMNATADGRRDMWKTMVAPLFNALLILTYHEKAKTNTWNMLRLLVGTFKEFMMIPKNTSNNLVGEMIGTDIEELVLMNGINSDEKWKARKERREPNITARTATKNYLRGIPNTWCSILKQQCRVCQLCKKYIMNEYHMKVCHNTEIFDYKKVWGAIKEMNITMKEEYKRRSVKKKKQKPVPRGVYLNYWRSPLETLTNITAAKFQLIGIN